MEQRFWGVHPVDRCTAYFFYHKEGVGSRLLYHLKYYNHPWVGEYLARCMAQEIQATSDFFVGIDIIVPVPLHPKKKRKRGYNQCYYISLGISNVTGIPIREDIVVRTRANETQTRKRRSERMENVQELFMLNTDCALEGKTLLIIDDVCTTGATILSVMDAFLSIPNIRFRVLALALTHTLD